MFVTAAVMRGQSFPLAAVFSSRELRNINNLVVTGDKVEGRLLEKHMAQMAQFVFFLSTDIFHGAGCSESRVRKACGPRDPSEKDLSLMVDRRYLMV